MITEEENFNKKSDNILFKPNLDLIELDEEQITTKKQDLGNTMNRSILNRSSMMTYGKILCCICSIQIEANPQGMCGACAKSQVNIAEGITTTGIVFYCKGCDRYQKPPWIRLAQESNDMMTFLLSRVKGMKAVKLIDSNFIWTEPHSKKKKIKITVQKEFNNTLLQTSLIIDFKEEWTQCDDCKKTFTPHLWNASCQVRQKVNHKRTFLFLEQAVLKHKMHEKALNVKETPEGVDFYFKSRSHANAFSDFVHSILPVKVKDSKRLVSHDQWSNLYNYKYSYMLEIAPVCKDDLIIFNQEEMKEFGGIGPVMLCYKTSTNVHLIDPLTFEVIDFDENTYWRHEFKSYIDRSVLQEFMIQNVSDEIDYKEKFKNTSITVTDHDIDMSLSHQNQSKSTNFKNTKKVLLNQSGQRKNYYNKRENHGFKIVNVDCTKITSEGKQIDEKLYSFRTHLGDKIKAGDICYGYDITSINTNLYNEEQLNAFPEIVLVKKKYLRPHKRVWKVKRMNIEKKMDEDEPIEGGDNDGKVINTKSKKANKKEKDLNKKKVEMEDNFEEFLQDVEEDKDMRKNINIYKDEDVLKELTDKFNQLEVKEILKKNDEDFGIEVEDLMENLKIIDEPEFKEPLPVKKKVKAAPVKKPVESTGSQLKTKRDKNGNEIHSCTSGTED